MAKVGRFVIDPRAGSYCQIDLDDGKKILVNHEKSGPQGGRMTGYSGSSMSGRVWEGRAQCSWPR